MHVTSNAEYMYLSADPDDIMSPSGDHEHLIKFWNVNQKRIYDAFIFWIFLNQRSHRQNLMATVYKFLIMYLIKPNIWGGAITRVGLVIPRANHAGISINPSLLHSCSLGSSHNLSPISPPPFPMWGHHTILHPQFAWQWRSREGPKITEHPSRRPYI